MKKIPFSPPDNLNQHNGAQYQRYGCQHLVGNTEQRPQALNAAQRIDKRTNPCETVRALHGCHGCYQ